MGAVWPAAPPMVGYGPPYIPESTRFTSFARKKINKYAAQSVALGEMIELRY